MSRFDRLVDWFLSSALGLETSRKGPIHRFYVRRGGDDGAWGAFIHHIVEGDLPGRFHNHPWDGWAFILGWYTEETPTTPPRRVWFLNRIRARGSHRAELPPGRTVWTLFIHLRRQNGGDWWFHDRAGVREGDAPPWRGPDTPEGAKMYSALRDRPRSGDAP